jgi:methionyl-tRNA formyltransferase
MTTKKTKMNELPFVFFGAGPIAAAALTEMEKMGVVPALVVTLPDAPAGRGRVLTPCPVAQWAAERNIETVKPEKLDHAFLIDLEARGSQLEASVFAVIDYGKFLPKQLLAIPKRGVLNMHPSLLPRLRGPSPIRSAILQDEKKTGVSVMLVDEEMDHGPIVAQRTIPTPDWPPHGKALDTLLATEGGRLMAEMLPLWAADEIESREQNHDVATYTRQFTKEDGLLDLSADPYANLLKIRAFEGWPGTYTFFQRGDTRIRVQILDARIANSKLEIITVKPEGKNEMPYVDFERTGAKLA